MRTPYASLFRLLSFVFMVTATAVVAAEDAATAGDADVELPSGVDVRFVVDVSGSMKRTDPNNLRRSAVAMVAELMPEGARGGLWTFARYVNMLAPLGEVDDQWRREVREAVPRIGSPGQYTNIGVALDTVTQDFWPGGGYEDTHVILLTDGMVDVPDGEAASQRERERILDEVVGHFQEHGATLHTMALSDEADHALLERLAVETGGQYTVAESDSDITRAFLSAFDAASPTEEVPLENNGFNIDGTVEEFTALIFRGDGESGAELVSPEGNRITRDSLPGDARWHATDDYDLVTIPEPATGRWNVDAIIGPDSRIKVVSELRMSINDLPAHFFASDSLPVKVAFFEEGERLTDGDFLGLIDLRLEIHDEEGGRQGTRRLSGEEAPANGIFRDTISTLSEPGRYEVRIIADGETFQRSERQTIELRPPFDTEVQARGSGDQSEYRFRVLGRDPGIDRETVSIKARVTGPGGKVREHDLAPTGEGAVWEWVLEGDRPAGIYRVQLHIQAETQDGRPIDLAVPSFEARMPRESDDSNYLALRPQEPEPEPAPEPAPDPEPAPEPEVSSEPKFDPEPVTRPEPQEKESGNGIAWWLWGSGITVLVALFAGGAGLWLWRRRRSAEPAEGESEAELVGEEPQPEQPPEAVSQPEPETSKPDDGESLAQAAAAYQAQQGESDDAQAEEEPEPEATPEPEAAPEPEEEEPELEADLDKGMDGIEESEEGDQASDEEIPTLDSGDTPEEADQQGEPEAESAPEPEAETEPEPEPEPEPESDPGALADQILDENQSEESEDDDEFSLEDFDISEFDDLPERDESDSDSKKDDEEDDKR